MKQAIGSALRKKYGQQAGDGWEKAAQEWINGLHPFSHVDKRTIAMVTKSGPTGLTILVGPDTDAWFFNYCAERGCAGIAVLLGELMLIRDSRGHAGSDAVRGSVRPVAAGCSGGAGG